MSNLGAEARPTGTDWELSSRRLARPDRSYVASRNILDWSDSNLNGGSLSWTTVKQEKRLMSTVDSELKRGIRTLARLASVQWLN
jgi:hypothetical protein